MHFKSGFNPFRKFSFSLFVDDDKVDDGGTGSDKDDKVDDKKDDKSDDEPTEAELKELEHARNLLGILKDPNARKALIRQLADEEGITKDSTKKEITEAKRTIKSLVSKHMGSEYSILNDRLSDLLTEFDDLINEDRIKPIGEKIDKSENGRLQAEALKGYDEAFGEYSNAKELEAAVEKLTTEIRPGPGQSAKSYFKRLIMIAAEEHAEKNRNFKLTKVSAKTSSVTNFNAERRVANRKDATSRIASEGADDGKVSRQSSKKLSIDEAIAEGARLAENILKG